MPVILYSAACTRKHDELLTFSFLTFVAIKVRFQPDEQKKSINYD